MKKNRVKRSFIVISILLLLSLSLICHIKLNFESSKFTDEEMKSIESNDNNIDIDSTKVKKEEVLKDKKTSATILASGDIMFHMPQVNAAYDISTDTYDFKDTFKYVKKYIDKADLSLGNFETVTAGKELGFKGFPNFNSPIETLEALNYAGYDVLSTANNHCLDQGKKGVVSTIDAIYKNGMKNIGTYKEKNNLPLIQNINDISIALLSYTYGCNGMECTLNKEELNSTVNLIDEDKIKTDIRKVKNEGVDLVVVFIHWGNEYQQEPSNEQIELGNKMVHWGADIIFGSHPHVIQSSEIVKNKEGKECFIIYSMGNFLSNQRKENMNNKYTEDGVMVNIRVEKDHTNGKTIIKDIDYIPTWVRKYKHNNSFKYEIIPIEDFLKKKEKYGIISKEVIFRMEESFEDTMNIIGQ